MNCNFKDKIVLITGASSGIGAATALLFADHGSSLAITGRNRINLEKVAKECKSKGAKDVLTIIADFVNLEDVKKVADEVIKTFGKLDILVNNAGVITNGNLKELTMEDFDWQFQVNVKSMVYLTQLLMPELVKRKGNIVNVSSICSVCQYPGVLIYNMTKSAVDQFTKTIALEYAPRGVRVNAVNPSNIWTEINRNKSGWDSETVKKFYEDRAKVHPIGRNGTTEEVANAILFFASESSAWTTGQCLLLDGGRRLAVN
uniref:3-oxoacyl-[acyl-carrier-protein] reductase FabG-like n=1 Tax=Styela clava TaxID=7725 RepID=UPI00193A9DA2|nr:3-oxoacyl-[acyl-carrier-protein] reductase FabG-like [Styela clava]